MESPLKTEERETSHTCPEDFLGINVNRELFSVPIRDMTQSLREVLVPP